MRTKAVDDDLLAATLGEMTGLQVLGKVEAEQIDVDEEMTARRLQWERQQATDRKRRADKWREARRRLNGYQEPVRGALLAYWQGCKWPADPSYFLSMLHMYDTGRLSLNIPKA